jgi:hypothetical protein
MIGKRPASVETASVRRRRTRAELVRLFGVSLALGAAAAVVLLSILLVLSAFFDFFAAVFALQRVGGAHVALLRAMLALGLLGSGLGLVAVLGAAIASWRGGRWPLLLPALAMPPVLVASVLEGLSPWPFAALALLAILGFAGALIGLTARRPK